MIRWLLAVSAVVVLQAYFLVAVSDYYPYLTLVIVLAAVSRLPWQQSLALSLWTGFMLDSFSMHTFGLFLLIYLGAWGIAKWFLQTGLVIKSVTGLLVAVLLLVFWQALLTIGVPSLQTGTLKTFGLAPVFIVQFIVTFLFALPLRRLL